MDVYKFQSDISHKQYMNILINNIL